MNDREDLAYAFMRALEASRTANEEQEAAEAGVGTPAAASAAHAEMERLGSNFVMEFAKLVAGHKFMAKRMEYEARRETSSGVEFRGGNAA